MSDPHAFEFDWKIDDPSVARLESYNGSTIALHGALAGLDPTTPVDLSREGTGSTPLHVTAGLDRTVKTARHCPHVD